MLLVPFFTLISGCGNAPLEKYVSPNITAATLAVTSADDNALARTDLLVEMEVDGDIAGKNLSVVVVGLSLRRRGGEKNPLLLDLSARFSPSATVNLKAGATTTAAIRNLGTTNGDLRPHCGDKRLLIEVAVKYLDQSFSNVGTRDVEVTCP